jgi:hypothetical protein
MIAPGWALASKVGYAYIQVDQAIISKKTKYITVRAETKGAHTCMRCQEGIVHSATRLEDSCHRDVYKC